MPTEALDPSFLFRLDDLEKGLLDLDAAGEPETARAIVHSVFREVHNLKGALAVPGLEGCAALAHEMETRLDDLRSNAASAGAELTDALLAAVDSIRASVEAGADAGDQVREASYRLLSKRERKAERGKAFSLDREAAERLERAGDLPLYLLEKAVDSSLAADALRGLPIFSALEAEGRIIDWRVVPGAGPGLSLLSLLFASATGADDLRFVVFDPFRAVAREDLDILAPAAPAGAAGDSPTRSLSLSRAVRLPRILIVDDEATSLFFLQSFLSAYGRIDAVADGQEAIERFEAAATGDSPYSLALLDILLPGISGIDILERIRSFERRRGIGTGDGARVVMSSAMGDYEWVSRAFAGGCDGFIVKPFRRRRVEALMAKLGFKPYVPDAGPNAALP